MVQRAILVELDEIIFTEHLDWGKNRLKLLL